MHPKILHCCEAPRSMLSNYFGKKQVLRGTFREVWRIQIQIYPQNSFEPTYGALTLENEVSAHGLGLVEENLVVIIFHCTLKNMKKVNRILIISKKINCKRSNSFPYCQVIQYQVIHLKHKLNWFSKIF